VYQYDDFYIDDPTILWKLKKEGEGMPRHLLRKSSKLIVPLFVLLWMLLIFIFSSQPYESQDLKPWLQSVLSFERIPRYLYQIQLKYGGHLISIKTLVFQLLRMIIP
jgi:hypothetical protein